MKEAGSEFCAPRLGRDVSHYAFGSEFEYGVGILSSFGVGMLMSVGMLRLGTGSESWWVGMCVY